MGTQDGRTVVVEWTRCVTYTTLVMTVTIWVVTGVGPPNFNFLPKTIDIFENRTSPFKTMEATARHPDGSPFIYTMVSSPPGGPFIIDSVTGEISSPPNPRFDYENISQYVLDVTVDDGNLTATETLTVNVIDVNEKPTFDNLPGLVYLPEDTLPTYVIYNLLSTDPEGDKVTYSLISPINAPFDVFPSGVITLQTNPGLDYETKNVYRLALEVKDKELYSTQVLTIIVEDVNEPPKILNMGVTLTLPRGTLGPIYYVQAFDEDRNEQLMYTFTSVPPSEFGDPFVLNPATGELVVHNPTGLDPSVTNLYTINVTVMDKEGFTDSGLLTIRIVDITDVPEIWNLPLTVFVKETEKYGLKIFHARTIDMINGTLIYNMTVSPDDRKFRITYKEGEVWYIDNPNFDFEKISSYEISVTVSNGKKVSQAKSIYVNIKDVNEPPNLDNLPAFLNLKEDFVKAGTIFKVSGSDQDAGSSITYNMTVHPSDGNSKFTLDPITGEVSVASNPNFDYERAKLYMLMIKAFDGELLSGTGILRVKILNVNEAPRLPSSAVTLEMNEEEPVGYHLPWNCTAQDEDDKEVLSYNLAPTVDRQFFTLDTRNGCALVLAQTIDSEDPAAPESLILRVTVTDSGGMVAAVSVIVNVLEVNDHAPVFSPDNYLVHIIENEDVDAPVVSLNVTDGDSGLDGDVIFNITTPEGRDYFDVSLDGEVTLASHLDREDVSVVAFDVVASDRGSPPLSATASVTVVILDENDNRPVFLKSFYDFEARYDSAKGTMVGLVSAIDTDKPSKILEYSILGISHEFEIGSVSGVIQTKQKLISNLRYLLYVQAQDTGFPPEVSEAVGVRIDTYVCEESLVKMDVYRQPSFFDASGKAQFTSAMAGLFPGFVARVGEVRAGSTQTLTLKEEQVKYWFTC
ncbi:protein dachsous-like isoform X2 [Liolophura sinensis]|uniref:protein dachsous-like isoform X2 n=1 Tax=Liolophura sinensis TaxID=3198878 RepID=UPI00315988A8